MKCTKSYDLVEIQKKICKIKKHIKAGTSLSEFIAEFKNTDKENLYYYFVMRNYFKLYKQGKIRKKTIQNIHSQVLDNYKFFSLWTVIVDNNIEKYQSTLDILENSLNNCNNCKKLYHEFSKLMDMEYFTTTDKEIDNEYQKIVSLAKNNNPTNNTTEENSDINGDIKIINTFSPVIRCYESILRQIFLEEKTKIIEQKEIENETSLIRKLFNSHYKNELILPVYRKMENNIQSVSKDIYSNNCNACKSAIRTIYSL